MLATPPASITASPAPSWALRLSSDDIDAFAAAQPDWDLRYEQLSAGRFEGQCDLVQLPQMRLVRETGSRKVRQRGHIGADNVGFALTRSAQGPCYFHGLGSGEEHILVGRGDELDLTTGDAYEHLAIVVDRSLLSALWERLYLKPWSGWLDQRVAVPARPGQVAYVRALHLDTLAQVQRNPALLAQEAQALRLRDALLLEWLEALPERVNLSDVNTATAQRRVTERAIAQMMLRPDEPPTLLALCQSVGVSSRKLDYCFRHTLGESPARLLRVLRLNAVRRALLSSRPEQETLQDVAARWGFWHMSAFAKDYRQQFGELPSATRQRLTAPAP